MITKAKSRVFIHYGSNEFDPVLFMPVSNGIRGDKPEGGLWACDVNTEYGWKEFCLAEEMFPPTSPRITDHFHFRIKESANILQLITPQDFTALPILWSKYNRDAMFNPFMKKEMDCYRYVDWEALKKAGIDAVEYIRTPYGHDVFYTWDFDSLVVLNPDVITEVYPSAQGN